MQYYYFPIVWKYFSLQAKIKEGQKVNNTFICLNYLGSTIVKYTLTRLGNFMSFPSSVTVILGAIYHGSRLMLR